MHKRRKKRNENKKKCFDAENNRRLGKQKRNERRLYRVGIIKGSSIRTLVILWIDGLRLPV